MLNLKKQYKKPPSTFGNTKKIKVSLVQEQQTRRRKRRTQDFEEKRKMDPSPSAASQNNKLRTKLSDWKAERERKRKMQESKKKPPFIVGIVHHHVYSPVSTVNVVPKEKKKKTVAQAHKNSTIKRGITKATEKRLLAKVAKTNSTEKLTLTNGNMKTPPSLHSSVVVKKENSTKNLMPSQEHLNNTEANIEKETQNDSDLYQISGSSRLSDGLAIKDVKTENPDMPMEGREYTVEYFVLMLDKEKERLQKLCKKWTEIQSQDDITEDVRYRINQAVGQTTMLIKEKFKQFHSLILDCEKNDGDVLITCTDLHGFWDMMYIEVKDCDSRFAKLEKLQDRCWQEDQSFLVKSTKPKKKATIKKEVPAKQSSPRALILSGKKKKNMTEIHGNKKHSQKIINVNDKCITPCINNKSAVSILRKSSNDKRFLEIPTNYMYTSTPLSVNATPNISSQFRTPLITMKVSQLYNKSMMQLVDTPLHVTHERTPRKNLIEELENPERYRNKEIEESKSPRRSLRIKLARKADLDDHLTLTKSSDETVEISQNSRAPSKKIDNFESNKLNSNKRIHVEGKSDSASSNSSVQTVIEKTIRDKSVTLKSSSHSTDSIETSAEGKRFIKESLSNKSLMTRSRSSSKHWSVNKVVKSSYGTPSTGNNLPTPRDASLIQDVTNISLKITPNTDRVPKRHNSSIKISWKQNYHFRGYS